MKQTLPKSMHIIHTSKIRGTIHWEDFLGKSHCNVRKMCKSFALSQENFLMNCSR